VRVLVCGGRDYRNWLHMYAVLASQHERHRFTAIIEGGASGADAGARTFGEQEGIPVETFPADWSDLSHPGAIIRTRRDGARYDATAGHRRNQRMLEEGRPNLVIAFPGGRGTADMVRRSRKAGVEVVEVAP
jgi:predicted Rossmann-fold nucleotide-binding protein